MLLINTLAYFKALATK